ncbi:MAG: excinuclease ABC subunit UvrA [Planctomycetes bacterium]|nr:excinuclease ABC subunit UvrA [Planctomycetota bacterium]
MSTTINLRGVRVHNLKAVDVDIPLGRLTVISGVSGAGKTSLAFDTLYAEAQRRYWQSLSAASRQLFEKLDKPHAEQIAPLPPAVALRRTGPRGQRATVGSMTEISDLLSLLMASAGTVICLQCSQAVRGNNADDALRLVQSWPTGTRFSVAFPAQLQENRAAWITSLVEEGNVRLQIGKAVYRLGEQELPADIDDTDIWVVLDRLEVGKLTPERLLESLETAFARGQGRLALLIDDGYKHIFDRRFACPHCERTYPAPEPRLFNVDDPLGACPICSGAGVDPDRKSSACPGCHGMRLAEAALSVFLCGRHIGELTMLPVADLIELLANLSLDEGHRRVCQPLVEQLGVRLGYLREVGLEYLTLNRPAASLSTGEAQRVALATALGANLVNALYILDEPAAGLHASDIRRLIRVLHKLRDAGNTLVVVENHPAVLAAADHLVELGPGAGEEGGEVLHQGPPERLQHCEASLTAAFLSGRREIHVPSHRRACNHGWLRVAHAEMHNLHDLTVAFPLGVLCAVTGVNGAGKTTLVQHVLHRALERHKSVEVAGETVTGEIHGAEQIGDFVLMDQAPLPRSSRISPATYLKVFDEIRKRFADTTEARLSNLGPAAFSFNQAGGRCDTCEGLGTLTVDLPLLADVTMTCPECRGARFRPEVLKVKISNLSIADVLNLTVREAFRFFRAQRSVQKKLKRLLDVGLDYLPLGQSAETLSVGECQRLKLAGHLASSKKPRCLFILNEPTAGLHPADVARLLDSFARLLETGHSLIIIEYNLDVIKCADWVIDLGPGAGSAGGKVVALGTPEEVARVSQSLTGQHLSQILRTSIPL